MLAPSNAAITPPASGGGIKLGIKRAAADQPVVVPEGASPGQVLLLQSFHEQWFKPQAEALRTALAESFGVAERQVNVHVIANWESVDPLIKERLEEAARLKLPVDLHIESIPEEDLEREVGNLGIDFSAEGMERSQNWGLRLTAAAVTQPPLTEANRSSVTSGQGYQLPKRLNEFFTRFVDEQEIRNSMLQGERRTAVFYAVQDDFANLAWTPEEKARGYRFTEDISLVLNPEGGKTVYLNYAGGVLPDEFSPSLSKRKPNQELKVIGVEFLIVLPKEAYTYESGRAIFDAVVAKTNLRLSGDLRDEIAQRLFENRVKDENDPAAHWQKALDERRKQSGLESTAVALPKVSAADKFAFTKRVTALRGAILQDEAIERDVRTRASGLLANLQQAGPNAKAVQNLIEILPPQYAAQAQAL